MPPLACSRARIPPRFANPESQIPNPEWSQPSSSMKVVVRMAQPVLPNRAEHVELERIIECLCLMPDPRRYVQNFACADDNFSPADQKLEGTLQDVRHLLAFVRVHRNQAAALQVDLRQHLARAGDD